MKFREAAARVILWLHGEDLSVLGRVEVRRFSLTISRHGIEGPCLRVDNRAGRRQLQWLVWDRAWFVNLIGRLT